MYSVDAALFSREGDDIVRKLNIIHGSDINSKLISKMIVASALTHSHRAQVVYFQCEM